MGSDGLNKTWEVTPGFWSLFCPRLTLLVLPCKAYQHKSEGCLYFQNLKIFGRVFISCGFTNKIKYQGQVKQQSMIYFISPHFLLLKEHEKHSRAVCGVHLPSNMTSRLIGMKENVTLDYNCPLRVLSLMLLLLCSETLWGKTQWRALLRIGATLNK